VRYGQGVTPLIFLDEPAAQNTSIVGGKAAVLSRLMNAGHCVLPGVVVQAQSLDDFLAEKGWTDRADRGDPTLAEDIRSSRIGPELAGALRSAVAGLGECVVVRSSGIDEDGEAASWAGQFETVIGVRPGDETERAILTCWASAFVARVEAYQNHHGEAGRARLAVLIQPVVEPRCAGVMFTVNPLTGSWREMTVEAAWGQAAPVVQGEVVPDAYVVRRPRRLPRPIQRVIARVRLDVVEDMVRPQTEMATVADGGLQMTAVPAERIDAPKLRHAELLRLCRLGLRVEALMGGPQDIEWALDANDRFVLLQSRPVTTHVGVRRSGPALWTRRFIGERWTEPATPLGWSLVRTLLDDFIAFPDTQMRILGGGTPTRLVRFAPYMNVTIFRHLAFKLPGAPPPRFMMELLPPEEQHGWVRRRGQRPDFRVYGSVIRETIQGRKWRSFAPNPLNNPERWSAFLSRLDAQLPSLEIAGGDPMACLAQSDRCRALAEQYIGVHICSLLWANLLYQLCEGALLRDGDLSLARDVLRPVEESWTVRTNYALWRLGRGELELDSFLSEFGHRAASSWELFSPRWREQPAQIDVLSEAASQHGDPAELAATQAQRAKDTVQQLRGPTRWLVRKTQEYLLLRENQRFHFDRLLWAWKVQLTAIEDQLEMPVRFLQIEELEALVSGRLAVSEAQERIGRREQEWNQEAERRRQGDEPPTFLVGSEGIDMPKSTVRLQGTGASPGVVTGIVRVLRTPEDGARLQPGDILVARATDPGWTPLFLKAGGLIVELGGMLSHGAVVAREYGLPAVANVAGATTHLEEGQVVTIDGRQGVVWVQ
jgi:phosphohistidine swiveling domain-containing protein